MKTTTLENNNSLSLSLESVCVQSWGGFEGGDALYNPISLLRSLSLLLLDIIPKRDTHHNWVRPFDDDVLKQHAPKTTFEGNLGPQRERDGLLKNMFFWVQSPQKTHNEFSRH